MKKNLIKIQDLFISLCITVMSSPLWAAMPTPRSDQKLDANHDTVDVGSAVIFKVVKITSFSLGAFIMLGVAATVLKAFHTAQEKQDLGHFFKTLLVGILVASVGVFLVYSGYSIIPDDGKV